MHACKRCNMRFSGRFCPYCGAEYGAGRAKGRPVGFFGGLMRFVGSLLALAVTLAIALVALDCTAYAHDPAHTTVYAIVQSVRNAIPADALAVYDTIKAQALEAWGQVFDRLFERFAG